MWRFYSGIITEFDCERETYEIDNKHLKTSIQKVLMIIKELYEDS
jgi:hypothetical protein